MLKPCAALAIQQDREQIVRHHGLDDRGDVFQQLVEIERFRRDARHFEQEIEQFGALAEDGGFARHAHQYPDAPAGAAPAALPRSSRWRWRRCAWRPRRPFSSDRPACESRPRPSRPFPAHHPPHQRDVVHGRAARSESGGRLDEIRTGGFRQCRMPRFSDRRRAAPFPESPSRSPRRHAPAATTARYPRAPHRRLPPRSSPMFSTMSISCAPAANRRLCFGNFRSPSRSRPAENRPRYTPSPPIPPVPGPPPGPSTD